jgi:hypothetical protein
MLEENEATAPEETPLNEDLKLKWAKGRLSSTEVQSLANNARRQGAHSLHDLSKVGSFGENAGNLFRDLKKLFGTPVGSPPMDWIEIHLKGNPKKAHPVFWPHKFFQSLAADRPGIWLNRVRGLSGAAAQFWSSIATNEYVTNHPHLPRASWDMVIPLGFHGDGGGGGGQQATPYVHTVGE